MNKTYICDNNNSSSDVGGTSENEENVSSFQELNVVQGVNQADKHTCAITSVTSSEVMWQPLKHHYYKLHNQEQNQEEKEEQKEQQWKQKIEHQLSSLSASFANIPNDNIHDYSNIDCNKRLQQQEEQESNSFIHGISQNESIVPNTHEEHTSTQTQTPSQLHMTMQSSSSSSSYNISSAELNYKKERVQLHTSLIKCKRELSACNDKMNELDMQISTLEAEKNACQVELNAKVKQIESLQEQQLTWRAERVHLISLNQELHGERGELQRQLQEAWSMICDMYKSHGKSLSELEQQPLATHIRKISTATSSNRNEYDENKTESQNENGNINVKADHLTKSQELLLEPLISTLHDNIKQALKRFMQNKRVINYTRSEDISTLEKNKNTENEEKVETEDNTSVTNNNLPRKLWHCQRDFNTFVNLINKQFIQMETTITSLQHELQQKESMQIQKYELEKKKELCKLQNERIHNNILQNEHHQHIALKNATEHARRILLHAQESVERTEHELQTRKLHLAELLHVSPEWNLIEHAIQHMHLSLNAMETSAIQSVNSNNKHRIRWHNNNNSSYIEKQEQQTTTTTSSKEVLLQWRNVKSEIVDSVRDIISLLGTWRNFRERVAFTSWIDALRELLDTSTWSKPYSTRTLHNEVSHVDAIAKTIMTLCECASHFVFKSKILTEERNALNRFTFLRKGKLESSGLSTTIFANASLSNKHWTTVKSKPPQEQQGRCRLKRVITITLFCAWWMQKHRALKEKEKHNSSTTPSWHVCKTQLLMSIPSVQTTLEHQCVKKYDTSVISSSSNSSSTNNNNCSSSNDVTKSELSDAFATEVLEVILALDKRVQTALERNNTNA